MRTMVNFLLCVPLMLLPTACKQSKTDEVTKHVQAAKEEVVAAGKAAQEAVVESAQEAKEKAAATAKTVQKSAQQSVQAATEKVAEAREAFVRRVQHDLDDTRRKTEELQAKAKTKGKKALDEKIAALKKEEAVIQKSLDAVKARAGEAWSDARVDIDQHLDKLRRAYAAAEEELNK